MNTLRCDILRSIADQHPDDINDPNDPNISSFGYVVWSSSLEWIGSHNGFTTDNEIELLDIAIRHRLTPIIERIIKSGVDLNQQGNGYFQFPIEIIVQDNCDPQILELLLKNGADPNIKLHGGKSPLSVLVGGGGMCTLAMDLWDVLSGKQSRSMASVEKGFQEIHTRIKNIIKSIDLLIQYGADPMSLDENGKTAEDYAYSIGILLHLRKTRTSLKSQSSIGPNISGNKFNANNNQRNTDVIELPPNSELDNIRIELINAGHYNRINCIGTPYSRGAKRVYLEKEFLTGNKLRLLNIAIKHNLFKNVLQLIDDLTAEEINIRDHINNQTPLETALKFCNPNLQIIEALLKKGADVKLLTANGKHLLSLIGVNQEFTQLLSECWNRKAGISPNIYLQYDGFVVHVFDGVRLSELIRSLHEKNLEIVDLLLQYGLNPWLKDCDHKLIKDYCYSIDMFLMLKEVYASSYLSTGGYLSIVPRDFSRCYLKRFITDEMIIVI